jgi:hypothetical protein
VADALAGLAPARGADAGSAGAASLALNVTNRRGFIRCRSSSSVLTYSSCVSLLVGQSPALGFERNDAAIELLDRMRRDLPIWVLVARLPVLEGAA